MLNIDTVLLLFKAYKKLLSRQLTALQGFDMETYFKLHPDRMQLAQEYQKTVALLIETDLKSLNLKREVKTEMQKLLRSISDDLEKQKKLLFYAQKTHERVSNIHKDYAQRATVTTYGACGYQPHRRESVVALSEVS